MAGGLAGSCLTLFGAAVVVLVVRPLGDALTLRARRHLIPVAYDAMAVASVNSAIAETTEAYQAQLEHLRAALHHPDVSVEMIGELQQDLNRSRKRMDLAWLARMIG